MTKITKIDPDFAEEIGEIMRRLDEGLIDKEEAQRLYIQATVRCRARLPNEEDTLDTRHLILFRQDKL